MTAFHVGALDFTGVPGLRTLGNVLPAPGPGLHVVHLDPLAGPPAATLPERARLLANTLVHQLPGAGQVAPEAPAIPLLLVASCTGAALAAELARVLEKQRREVTSLALLDPLPVDAEDVDDAFHAVLAGLGATAGAVRVTGRTPFVDMEHAVRAGVRVALSDLAPSEAETLGEQLAARYMAWLGFLRASVDGPTDRVGADVHLVLGRDQPDRTPWPARATTHRVTAPSSLISDEARRLLAQLLTTDREPTGAASASPGT